MPNQPKTPTRPIRIDLDLWERFGALAEPDRSAVLRAFISWFVREPGAKMPRRPAAWHDYDQDPSGGGDPAWFDKHDPPPPA